MISFKILIVFHECIFFPILILFTYINENYTFTKIIWKATLDDFLCVHRTNFYNPIREELNNILR